MGIIENIQQQKIAESKAKAYDDMVRTQEQEALKNEVASNLLNRFSTDEGLAALAARRDQQRIAELNSLMQTRTPEQTYEAQMPYRMAPTEEQYPAQVENYGMSGIDYAISRGDEVLPSPIDSGGLADLYGRKQ